MQFGASSELKFDAAKVCCIWGLTSDMSGGFGPAQLAQTCPLDGEVRSLPEESTGDAAHIAHCARRAALPATRLRGVEMKAHGFCGRTRGTLPYGATSGRQQDARYLEAEHDLAWPLTTDAFLADAGLPKLPVR